MKRNDIVAAPQVIGTANMMAVWRAETLGSADDFYNFLTTPTADRDDFLFRYEHSVRFMGRVVMDTVTVPSHG